MWHVYILECADSSYYTGSTNRLAERVEKHNKGEGAKYTRSKVPVKLIYTEQMPNKGSALKREREIKGSTKAMKRNLVKTGFLTSRLLPK